LSLLPSLPSCWAMAPPPSRSMAELRMAMAGQMQREHWGGGEKRARGRRRPTTAPFAWRGSGGLPRSPTVRVATCAASADASTQRPSRSSSTTEQSRSPAAFVDVRALHRDWRLFMDVVVGRQGEGVAAVRRRGEGRWQDWRREEWMRTTLVHGETKRWGTNDDVGNDSAGGIFFCSTREHGGAMTWTNQRPENSQRPP
jgi:hypothetical protein